jgi:carboxylesterase
MQTPATSQAKLQSQTAIDPRRDVGRSDAQPLLLHGGDTACLLVHGFTSTPYEVRELGLVLHGAGHTVQTILLPGHGTRPEELVHITWQQWCEAVASATTSLQAEYRQVVLIGISLGAALCLWQACESNPAGVVGLGTPLLVPRWQRLFRWLAPIYPMVPKKGGKSSIRDPEACALHPSYGVMPLAGVLQFHQLLDALQPRLPHLHAPLLLIHSRHDPTISPECARVVYQRAGSKHKKLIWVDNSDHIITEDYDKQIVFDAVCQFAANLDAPGGPFGE